MNKGDIVINIYTTEDNPYHRLLYISRKKRECTAMSYDGKIKRIVHGDESLKRIGHMKEYDDFINALRKLGDGERKDGGQDATAD